MKFENFVIVSFQIIANNYWFIVSYIYLYMSSHKFEIFDIS